MMSFKEAIKSILTFVHLDITKNMKYDRLTLQIMKRNLKEDSNCIDIGCHKGEILDLLFQVSPKGKHFAFEPIPYLHKNLEEHFGGKATIFPYALSDRNGESTFNLVKNAPAYSGIKKRRYDISNPEIEEIKVSLRPLDEVIPTLQKIDFIKVDVEGGEFDVMKGAKRILTENKPIVLFECGKGASDYYGTLPADIYNYLTTDIGLNIYTLKSFVTDKLPMNKLEFENYYNTNAEYYFVAA